MSVNVSGLRLSVDRCVFTPAPVLSGPGSRGAARRRVRSAAYRDPEVRENDPLDGMMASRRRCDVYIWTECHGRE